MNAFTIADPMKLVLVISWLLFVPRTVSAQTDHTRSPAPAEDCTELSPELQAVVAAMDGPGSRIEALSKPESAPVVEPGIYKLEMLLRPLSEVGLVGKENLSWQSLGREGAMAGETTPSQNVESLFGGF